MLPDVERLIEFLGSLDGVYDAPAPFGDPVDLLAHGLQCAQVLRSTFPADVGLQLAGLVHDVGHASDAGPDHARVGADAVRGVLGERVAMLVALHVEAKRYLAAVEDYYGLSEASRLSLSRQGGAMSRVEVGQFRSRPEAADAVRLRQADEAAKVVGLRVPDLVTWVPRLREYVA